MNVWLGVFLGMLLYSVAMAGMGVMHVLCVWFFYWLNPENPWYSENYHDLPKWLHIFDKH